MLLVVKYSPLVRVLTEVILHGEELAGKTSGVAKSSSVRFFFVLHSTFCHDNLILQSWVVNYTNVLPWTFLWERNTVCGCLYRVRGKELRREDFVTRIRDFISDKS